jgi:predicted TIM-barrel fold metal-dependent hydrolase
VAIDFHTYVQTRSYLKQLRKRAGYPRIEQVNGKEAILAGPGTARPVRPEQNDIEARLAAMDASGIQTQILRLQNVSGVDAFDPAEGLEIAQAANEELGEVAGRYPGRFIAFATVTMRDPAAAAKELERSVTQLGHRGVGLSAGCEGDLLDSPRYEEIFATAARLRVPVFILPNHPSTLDAALEPYDWLSGAFGFQVDLSLVALRLVCAGTLDRHPDMNVIIANLGGVFPMAVQRLDHFWERMNAGVRPIPVRPSVALRRFHLGTASAHPAAILMAARIMGADRLVFGSDYPSFPFDRALDAVRNCGLAPDEVESVLSGNGKRLLAR